MTKERLILVTDFSTLRAGMIVVVRPCSNCARAHRAMLTRFATGWSTKGVAQPSFLMAPQPACTDPDDELSVGPLTVGRRKVYLVETGLEDSQTTQARKPKKLTRTA